uniref:Aldehyde dehydrogenase 16 family, member A1 n=2 Tax=Cyprinus carpio TaxID=7962 RepID=A0A8C2DNJ5_CYPCA
MAGTSAKTVHDIFQNMEYGPSSTSTATAQSWLEKHSRILGFFIDGKFSSPADRQTQDVTDSKAAVVCSTVCAKDEDVASAASSAAGGFKTWSELSCYQRAKVLLKLASVLQRHSQCVSELCELSQSSVSPAVLIRLAQYYASWAQLRDTLMPEWIPQGVVAVVVSDDCSVYFLLLKVLPALAMGNAVIVVPGKTTALPALLLAQLFMEAGIPAGVLNVVTGSEASLGAKVAQNPQVNYLTYSGRQQTGEALAKAVAGWGVPMSFSLSLSSVCPFIIFDSADLDSAVDGVIELAFKKKRDFQWVLCVQESVLDIVVARLKLRMNGMKCVPLATEADRILIDAAVQEAQQQGANTLIQSCPPGTGALYPPTVLCGLAPSCESAMSPPPGPVLPLISFRSSAEGVTLVLYGQAASIWTEDLTLALESAKSLCVGSVWVNCHSVMDPALPLCGRRESGNCTDGGRELPAKGQLTQDFICLFFNYMFISLKFLPQSGYPLSSPEALGVVGVILPNSKPLLSLVSLLGAAIAMGNAVVMVPSEKYPLPALEFIQVLQASDIPGGLVSIITGGRDQLTQALANHSVIQSIWYWGSKEGCQFLQYSCVSPLKRLWLHCEEEEEREAGQNWTSSNPSLQEELWRKAVVWKSIWIPTP